MLLGKSINLIEIITGLYYNQSNNEIILDRNTYNAKGYLGYLTEGELREDDISNIICSIGDSKVEVDSYCDYIEGSVLKALTLHVTRDCLRYTVDLVINTLNSNYICIDNMEYISRGYKVHIDKLVYLEAVKELREGLNKYENLELDLRLHSLSGEVLELETVMECVCKGDKYKDYKYLGCLTSNSINFRGLHGLKNDTNIRDTALGLTFRGMYTVKHTNEEVTLCIFYDVTQFVNKSIVYGFNHNKKTYIVMFDYMERILKEHIQSYVLYG